MKIWILITSIILGTTILGCSTSNDTPKDDGFELSPTDYQILLSSNSSIYAQNITSDLESIVLSNSPNLFPNFPRPEVEFRDGSKMAFYQKTDDCGGKVLSYDFGDGSEVELPVFSDLSSCELTVTAIARQENIVFLSYYLESSGKDQTFFVRTLNVDTNSITDFELDKKPTQLAVSNNRLFVLTWDENETDTHALKVLDFDTNTEVHDIDLGTSVGRIFTKTDGDIIISYPTEHITLNSSTLSPAYTRYLADSEPQFYNSECFTFDGSGKMYYVRNTDLDSAADGITAMHDFTTNGTVLYYFKNFLNEEQLNVEFDVQTATTISYDDVNNLILIGYKKNTDSGGGLMRITPAPNLTFVDNLDLDDYPTHIFPAN